jgi:hypothetical protein
MGFLWETMEIFSSFFNDFMQLIHRRLFRVLMCEVLHKWRKYLYEPWGFRAVEYPSRCDNSVDQKVSWHLFMVRSSDSEHQQTNGRTPTEMKKARINFTVSAWNFCRFPIQYRTCSISSYPHSCCMARPSRLQCEIGIGIWGNGADYTWKLVSAESRWHLAQCITYIMLLHRRRRGVTAQTSVTST